MLVRRIQRRMQVHQLTEFAQYIDLLHRDRREGDLLFKDLLISVTQFFRDPEAYDVLAREVLPKLVEGKTGDDEVRVWVAGCATGEEAYSIAMILREALTDTDDRRASSCSPATSMRTRYNMPGLAATPP